MRLSAPDSSLEACCTPVEAEEIDPARP